MNFLEALEANKTKRVRRGLVRGSCRDEWREVGEMQTIPAWGKACIIATWEAECAPRVLEFSYKNGCGLYSSALGAGLPRKGDSRWQVTMREILPSDGCECP